ncbi:MAG: ribulose-phosphate 3-epimerase [Symbiobacteriaceae bacterium]|nr:ribulose-phosphate 3-epimerase [Symbiobacteriaceae bacterium]
MIVAPSLFAADASYFGDAIRQVEKAGAQYLHIDVMDNAFVPNLSFGPNIVSGLRPHSTLYFDVHLMIKNPEILVTPFIEAGADCITIHLEATEKIDAIRSVCRKHQVDFGLALCPDTPIDAVRPWVDDLDLLLIMSIFPGLGGQPFLENAIGRIREAVELRRATRGHYRISVDGGINDKTGTLCKEAGADILVAGTYVFNTKDVAKRIASLL